MYELRIALALPLWRKNYPLALAQPLKVDLFGPNKQGVCPKTIHSVKDPLPSQKRKENKLHQPIDWHVQVLIGNTL